ncbi:MAG: DNA repair protein RecN [Oscillospiraceae bacterium]|jgi:DNA repair protein RecN (Recombination protein N)|nr:DNA repair protein RecN [Oscillospiraceae bacterium]
MLSQLFIENAAVIERAEINFEDGFNVLTGETGAGKSILIDSIGAVLGARVSKELIRTGAKAASVSAEFFGVSDRAREILLEAGFEVEDDTLILQREIREDGKSSCRINGRAVTASLLRDVGGELINIHGQHENTALLKPARHRDYLDALADTEAVMGEYSAAYTEYRGIKRRLSEFNLSEQEKERRLETLRYQTEEIRKADITVGEYRELTEKRDAYRNFERISVALSSVHDLLRGSEELSGAIDGLSESEAHLSGIADVFPAVSELSVRLSQSVYEAEDISNVVRDLLSDMEFDANDLDRAEARLNTLDRIFRKYGDEEETLLFLKKAESELSEIENEDKLKSELTELCEKAYGRVLLLSEKLSDRRKEGAEKFKERIMDELKFLDMPNAVFDVEFREIPPSPFGADEVEFLISANAGEPPKPISKIASGGELSRIMLAVKSVLSDKDDIGTLIFDEIDTGISGKAAQKVGVKLRRTSVGRQIICVTHLAQIAAAAHHHFLIRKDIVNGRTSTSVTPLDLEGRKNEVARIIGGETSSEAILKSAEEMIDSY